MAVLAFGVAFGYVEAAVVVYLRGALGVGVEPVFPLEEASGAARALVDVELGREIATLVMLGAVGWAAGIRPLDRFAWSAVAFGAWDLTYYGWLWVFSGWPASPAAWDVLFLVPVPWVGPVWAPAIVSAALVSVGLLAARRIEHGIGVSLTRARVAGGIGGGTLVVASFVVDAPNILAGGLPHPFAWPVFLAGMGVAAVSASLALRGPSRDPAGVPAAGPVA